MTTLRILTGLLHAASPEQLDVILSFVLNLLS